MPSFMMLLIGERENFVVDSNERRNVNFGDYPCKVARMVLEHLGMSMNQYCGKLLIWNDNHRRPII